MPEAAIVVKPQVTTAAVIQPPVPSALTVGKQGPVGPAGAAYSAMIAGEALGGHRIVTSDTNGNAIYADSSNPAHANTVIGMTLAAATALAPVPVQSIGHIEDSSFSFTPGDILFLGTNGLVTTSQPTSGFVLVIGFAESATKIFLNVGQPIILT